MPLLSYSREKYLVEGSRTVDQEQRPYFGKGFGRLRHIRSEERQKLGYDCCVHGIVCERGGEGAGQSRANGACRSDEVWLVLWEE
jgi:hypothetical protein